MRKLLARIPHSYKGVAHIAGGTGVAQLLAFASLPFLTRIYTPEAFGVFSYIFAIAMILVPVATLRLELAVPLPPEQKDSELLVRTGLVVSTFICVGIAAFVLIAGPWLDDSNELDLMPSLWFLPFTVLASAWFAILSQKAIAHKDYRVVGTRNVIQGIGRVVGQFGFALVTRSGSGLLAGNLFGSVLGIGTLARTYKHGLFISQPLAGSKRILKRYKAFPLVYMPSALLNILGSSLPLLLFGIWYGPAVVGMLGVVQRVLAVPAGLVSSSVGQVFLGEIAERVRTGQRDNRTLYLKATRKLAIVGLLIPVITIPLAPILTPIILGSDWAEAGYLAQPVAILAGVGFVVSPLSTVYFIYERALWNISADIFRIALMGAAALAVTLTDLDALPALWLLTIAYVLTYVAIWIAGLVIVTDRQP